MDLDLQGAIFTALAADSALQALIGNPVRLYQQVPPNPTFPYVTLGSSQEGDDSDEFLDAAEIFVDVHVWSRSAAKDYAECKRIGSTLRRVIHNANLTLSENRCVLIEHRITRTFADADNITRHGVVTFRALTEENLQETTSGIEISIPAGGLGTSTS